LLSKASVVTLNHDLQFFVSQNLAYFSNKAPTTFELITVLNQYRLEIGTGYRTSSSINFLKGVYLFGNVRFVHNYDMAINDSPLGNKMFLY